MTIRALLARRPNRPGATEIDDDAPIERSLGPLGRAWVGLPVWLQLAIIYVGSRIVTTVIMLAFASRQEATWQTPEHPGFFEFSNIWDAVWYKRIVEGGYPSELPIGEQGNVTENAWAFMPVFPLIVRVLATVSTLPIDVVMVIVSMLAGLGTTFAYHRLLRHFVGERTAMFAVVLLVLGPISPLFQVGYAEALHFWMLMLLLNLLVERRWMEMLPVVVIASLTRPTGLAWAFALLLVIIWRYRRSRSGTEPFPVDEQRKAWIAAVASGVAGLLWLLICAIATGRLTGYLDTEMAWRNHYTGGEHTFPFTPWFWAGDFWFGAWGPVIVVLIVVFMALWLRSPMLDRFGMEIRLWGIAYFAYVFAVFYPQSSVFRILFPLFPAFAPVAVPQSPLYRVGTSILAVAAQVLWITWMWFVIGHDWSPP